MKICKIAANNNHAGYEYTGWSLHACMCCVMSLPMQELLADDVEHPVMASLRISQRVSAQDSDQDSMETDQDRTPSGIVVAVGAKESSDVFVAVLHAEEGCSDAVLNWHQMQCPGLGTLCW